MPESPDEMRKRIEEEERIRLEVRQRLAGQMQPNSKPRRGSGGLVGIALWLIGGAVGFAVGLVALGPKWTGGLLLVLAIYAGWLTFRGGMRESPLLRRAKYAAAALLCGAFGFPLLFVPPMGSSQSVAGSMARPPTQASLVVKVNPANARFAVSNPTTSYFRKEQGSQRVGNLQPGTYTVTVSKPGYETRTSRVQVTAGEVESLEVSIRSLAAIAEERRREAERKRREEANKPSIDEFTLRRSCQNYVRDSLKAPATAKFPSLFSDEGRMWIYPKWAMYKSYVDSENSFGALIRTRFECKYSKPTNSIEVTFVQ